LGDFGDYFCNELTELMGEEFHEIKTKWISSPHGLFYTAFRSIPRPRNPEFSMYNHATCNGRITFETFMAAIGIKPRSLEHT